jgi:hypothetical protein
MMNKLVTCILTTSLLFGVGTLYATDSLDLEPCINGDVSASGTFPTQVAEDRHRFYAMAEQEPCMNGDVPLDGVVADAILGAQPEIGDRVSSNR